MRTGFARPAAIALFSVLCTSGIASGADLRQPTAITDPAAELVRDYVERRALVHIIRATFDVEAVADIPALIAEDLRVATNGGLTEDDLREVEVDLLAEGSYFIVSLEYLIKAGYPAWPDDKAVSTYANDALSRLDALPGELIAAIEAGEDPLDLFLRAGEVYRWTEGDLAGEDRADFEARDELVEQAFAAAAPESVSL